jgi:hypothetical protein
MSAAGFLRIKKLTGTGIITTAARHNRREIQAELGAVGRIDPRRTHLNQTLVGAVDAAGVGQVAKDMMQAAGVDKLRKDAVMGIECVFSLPPDHRLDDTAYFADCATWAERYFAGAEILSADIHRDEAAPHCHVLILPLVDGHMVGSDLFGGRPKLVAMNKHFNQSVAMNYGLSLAPAKRTRTMAEIFTSPGRGPKTEANPRVWTPEKDRTLCSVGFTPTLGFASEPLPAMASDPELDQAFKDWLATAKSIASTAAWQRVTA